MTISFKRWFLVNEAKKPAQIALELVGDKGVLDTLSKELPVGIKADEKNRYLLIMAYFYKSQPHLQTLKADMTLYHRLVGLNKMKLFSFDDNGKLNPQFKQYESYLDWTAGMHGMEYEEEKKKAGRYRPTDADMASLVPIATNGDKSIKIYHAKNVNEAIILGKGTTYCISQPGNTMFKAYRDSHVATFYFVHDKNRTDALDVVVIDVGDRGVLLTDRPNRTGSCQNPDDASKRDSHNAFPYLNYLKRNGINTNILKNIPKSEDEIREDELLGRFNNDLGWFVSLSPKYKSFYIGRGHNLTDEQFNFLMKHKLRDLLEQYVSTGLFLDKSQRNVVLADRELANKYIHNRLIGALNNHNMVNPITKDEYDFILKSGNSDYKDKALDHAVLRLDNYSNEDFSSADEPFYIDLFKNDDLDLFEKYEKHILEKLSNSLVFEKVNGKVVFKGDSSKKFDTKLYTIPLSLKELKVLKKINPELYKLTLIQISHTGQYKNQQFDADFTTDEYNALHPYAKLKASIEKDDHEEFDKYKHDVLNIPYAPDHPDERYRPRPEFQDGDDEFYGIYDNTPDYYKLALGALRKGKTKMAEKIVNSAWKMQHQIADDGDMAGFLRSIIKDKDIKDEVKDLYFNKLIDNTVAYFGSFLDHDFLVLMNLQHLIDFDMDKILPYMNKLNQKIYKVMSVIVDATESGDMGNFRRKGFLHNFDKILRNFREMKREYNRKINQLNVDMRNYGSNEKIVKVLGILEKVVEECGLMMQKINKFKDDLINNRLLNYSDIYASYEKKRKGKIR